METKHKKSKMVYFLGRGAKKTVGKQKTVDRVICLSDTATLVLLVDEQHEVLSLTMVIYRLKRVEVSSRASRKIVYRRQSMCIESTSSRNKMTGSPVFAAKQPAHP